MIHDVSLELREASENVVQFAQASFAATGIKQFGDVIDTQDVIKVQGTSPFDEITLPFFGEVPSPEKKTEDELNPTVWSCARRRANAYLTRDWPEMRTKAVKKL